LPFQIGRLVLPIALGLVPAAFAGTINIGFLLVAPASSQTARFDIGNETGPNSSPFPDTSFPVTTPVPLSGLMLTVNFSNNTAQTFTDFALASDNLSFVGQDLFDLAATPIASAILSGTFGATSLTLNDGSKVTILPEFAAILIPSSGSLQEGNFTLITATTAAVPEPRMAMLLLCGLSALALLRQTRSLRVHGLRQLRDLSRSELPRNKALPVSYAAEYPESTCEPNFWRDRRWKSESLVGSNQPHTCRCLGHECNHRGASVPTWSIICTPAPTRSGLGAFDLCAINPRVRGRSET
jgi:hypothetical protein